MNFIKTRSTLKTILASMAIGATVFSATATAAWPERPITLIAPFAPGGSTDMLARVIAQALAEELDQPVVVANKGGAGGTLGASQAAKSAADGYTVLLSNVTLTSAGTAYRNLNYDIVSDFEHVAYLGAIPCVLVSSQKLPVSNIGEFLAYLKANPGKLNYGSSGIGAASHLCGQSFLTAGGFKAEHVPYKGAGPMMVDVIAGNLAFAVDTAGSAASQIKGDKVRGLAVTSDHRIELLPDLPTLKESGVPFDMSIWYGLVMPKDSPLEAQKRLYEATNKISSNPKVMEAYKSLGLTRDKDLAFGKFVGLVKDDKIRWSEISTSAGITPQ